MSDVLEASRVQEALAFLKDNTNVDLLATDVGLSDGFDGRDLAEAVRNLWPGLPVLFVTGHDPGDLSAMRAAEQHVAVLAKPFTAPALVREVEKLLDRS